VLHIFYYPKNSRRGIIMNKDQVEGKAKDIAGRVERQAGEWTGNKEAEVRGAAKQAGGKVQNAWGDVKDAGQKAADKARTNDERTRAEKDEEIRSDRKAS
jgi:uncharacterized protein YjbJ (UPF0337 family)